MAQRNSEYERKERNLYETPVWVTQALMEIMPRHLQVWECACASGAMAKVIGAKYASDLVTDYGSNGVDFLAVQHLPVGINAIVTNPPFGKDGEDFIRHGMELLEGRVDAYMAMLLPIDYDSAKTRYDMFAECSWIAGKLVLTSRIVWFEPAVASPSTNHAWFIWDKHWLKPPMLRYHFK